MALVAVLAVGQGTAAQDDSLTPGAARTVVLDAGAARSLTFVALAGGFVRLRMGDQHNGGSRSSEWFPISRTR